MSRKTKEVTAHLRGREGRDVGKRFLLTEMPATAGDKWAYRALSAMARSGLDVPPHIADLGMAGVLAMGLKAILGAEFAEAEPLLDELMTCVTRVEELVPAGRPLVENDTEEIVTIGWLRSEVLELHTGFSIAAFLSKTWAEAAERVRKADDSRNTRTSGE
jgi:hypothetical protein